jgi:hypothetical protein
MNVRQARFGAAALAFCTTALVTGLASAQEYYDGARFRGGVTLGGGPLIIPGVVNIGTVGIQGQIGGQINNNWGVYAIPSFDVIVGQLGGLGLGAGVLADYTFDNVPISVGLGPEVGVFIAFGSSGANGNGNCDANDSCTGSAAGGAFYGARLHFAYYPIIVRRGIHRRALSIGLDMRLLTGAFGATSATVSNNNETVSASVNSFAVSPVVSVGYAAF